MERKRSYLNDLLRTRQTVFSFRELMLLWGGIDGATARARIHYYVKTGNLIHLRRGLYATDKDYDRFELATRIYTPAYISFETVLADAGVTFQYDNRIFVASYQSRDATCDNRKYVFKTLKRTVLTNPAGIESRPFYAIATPERAFLDMVYLNRAYHFDNLIPLDWDRIYRILPAYGPNRRMRMNVDAYHDSAVHGA